MLITGPVLAWLEPLREAGRAPAGMGVSRLVGARALRPVGTRVLRLAGTGVLRLVVGTRVLTLAGAGGSTLVAGTPVPMRALMPVARGTRVWRPVAAGRLVLVLVLVLVPAGRPVRRLAAVGSLVPRPEAGPPAPIWTPPHALAWSRAGRPPRAPLSAFGLLRAPAR